MICSNVSSGPSTSPVTTRTNAAQRLKRSVLDTVVDQYKFYTGANSPLSTTSKARVAEHLDRIREFEQRAYAMKGKVAGAPESASAHRSCCMAGRPIPVAKESISRWTNSRPNGG